MCRLFIYKGKEQLVKNLLWLPWHSLLKQSFREPYTPLTEFPNPRDHPINVDGFGVCWYKNSNTEPCLYTNTVPPWNDRNLLKLSQYMNTTLFFAHVRGIKPFSATTYVHEYNCHPFCYKNITWMHNGDITMPILLKKYVYENLSSELLDNIKGNTDSEYAFHIFINQLFKKEKLKISYISKYEDALIETIKIIDRITKNVSSMNFSVTDGNIIVCSRYISANIKNETPPSLYISMGDEYISANKKSYMIKNKNLDDVKCVIISSEPIDNHENNWKLVPKNTILSVDESNKIKIIGI